MLHKKALKIMLAIVMVAITITACKKDPFTEKDAIAAQKDLLTMKYSYDLSIAQVALQIQHSSDSAKIVLQGMVNAGATAQALAKFNYDLALKMQDYNNLLNQLKFQDSLSKASNAYFQAYSDSLNALLAAGGIKSYQVRVLDSRTNLPVSGAVVKVLPWKASAFVTATTNTDGIATFNNLTVGSTTLFFATDPTVGVTSSTTSVTRSYIDAGNAVMLFRYTTVNPGPIVKGTLFAETDLTNASNVENAGPGKLVTFSTLVTPLGNAGGPQQTFQFPTTTDLNGAYSISLPSNLSYSISTPGSITVSQKQFVNFIQGQDNPVTSAPRIDSIQTVLAKSSLNPLALPTGVKGYFLMLPADSVSGLPGYVRDNNFLYNTIQQNIRSLSSSGPVDTMQNFVWFGNTFGLNQPVVAASFDPLFNYKVRLDASNNKIPDTLTATLVDLTGVFVKVSPKLVVITTPNGKIDRIQLLRDANNNPVAGAGGAFNVTALGGTPALFPGAGLPTPIFNSPSGFTAANAVSLNLGSSSVSNLNYYYGTVIARANNVVPK